jgi:hypothetical protein
MSAFIAGPRVLRLLSTAKSRRAGTAVHDLSPRIDRCLPRPPARLRDLRSSAVNCPQKPKLLDFCHHHFQFRSAFAADCTVSLRRNTRLLHFCIVFRKSRQNPNPRRFLILRKRQTKSPGQNPAHRRSNHRLRTSSFSVPNCLLLQFPLCLGVSARNTASAVHHLSFSIHRWPEFHQSLNPNAQNCVFRLKNHHPTPIIATV